MVAIELKRTPSGEKRVKTLLVKYGSLDVRMVSIQLLADYEAGDAGEAIEKVSSLNPNSLQIRVRKANKKK